jgi:septum formation protein
VLYLASTSKQRKDLLTKMGLPFKVVKSSYRERPVKHVSASGLAVRHAIGKAMGVKQKRGVILAADTLVSFAGKVIGKPRNREHALRLIKSYSGKSQSVYTAVALRDVRTGRLKLFCEKSKVTFKKMSDRDIRAYIQTGEYRNKAGGFGLQGKGSHLIESTSGSRSNILGLPTEKLKKALKSW